jgi:hypothetical protein
MKAFVDKRGNVLQVHVCFPRYPPATAAESVVLGQLFGEILQLNCAAVPPDTAVN